MIRLRRMLAILACAWAVGSCGGGGEQASNGSGVGTGGTGGYANGPVTAFGSVVVNGIHFEPGKALITRIDQPSEVLASSDLQLGMMLEIESTPLAPAEGKTVADATRIKIVSQLRGRVSGIGTQTLTMLGQTVKLTSATHLDAASMPAGLASIAVNDKIEVYGFHDVRTDTFVATRLVKLDATDTREFVLQGVVSDLDRSTGRCRIGHQVIYVFNVATLPADLRNGQTVRVLLLPSGPSTGTGTGTGTGPASTDDPSLGLPAFRMSPFSASAEGLRDAALDGLVSDIEATTPGQRRFRLNGVPVDATALPACAVCDVLQAGDRVQVRGTLRDGVVSATSVIGGTAAP